MRFGEHTDILWKTFTLLSFVGSYQLGNHDDHNYVCRTKKLIRGR